MRAESALEEQSRCASRNGARFQSRNGTKVHDQLLEIIGWGGRVRTSEWRNQNPLPYHLATPQQSAQLGPTSPAAIARPSANYHTRQTITASPPSGKWFEPFWTSGHLPRHMTVCSTRQAATPPATYEAGRGRLKHQPPPSATSRTARPSCCYPKPLLQISPHRQKSP